MKKILLETSFSKIYMIVMIIVTLLILGGYFSYAMFTVTKEKENAISIVTGNLTSELLIDGKEGNTLTVPANSRQDFIVTLNNPNNRIARFNFYYLGSLHDGVDIGYIEKEGINTPPSGTGINLEKVDTTGSSNTYIVRVSNTTESEISIELGVSVGLDYNDLELPDDGHLLRKIISEGTVSEVIKDDIMNNLNYEDEEQTFVTGSNPYNYIWYSGKLWRVVSIDPSDNSVKLITQWDISTIAYNTGSNTTFINSSANQWLNDTSVDGFLGNLRSPESFIKMDSKWNVSEMSDTSKPPSSEDGGTIVETPVGLLNVYEYNMTGGSNSYLNNSLYWWTITANSSSTNYIVSYDGSIGTLGVTNGRGIRPVVNLNHDIKIVAGDGSSDNPYRLEGDNDNNLSGTLLNTRYSGEYISFGIGENNLYRIVSHETEGLTKVVLSGELRENGSRKNMPWGNDSTYLGSNVVNFINGEYLTSGNYLTSEQVNMIEDNTTWYLGTDKNNAEIVNSKVGLLRRRELMAGQFNIHYYNANYYVLTENGQLRVFAIYARDELNNIDAKIGAGSIKPAFNLKQNVIITGGDGTLQNPFQIALE